MAEISTQQLELLYDVSRSLHGLIEIDALLPFVVTNTKELLDAEGCSVILLDEAGRELYFPWVSPENSEVAERLRRLRMPADKGIAGAVLQAGRSLLVPDVRADARFYSEVDQQTGGATRSIICAPLRTQRGIIGVIECINKRAGAFIQADLTFLEALAGSIAVAIDNARLYQTLKLSEARLRDEVALLERERHVLTRFSEVVGKGQAMEKVFRLVESAIGSPITVLLQGETGSGKEVIARAIHFHSPRKDKPFVAVNCGAFPETLLESELFGYRKGAFTGANTDKRGLFDVADGGSMFLDEIGDTPPPMQAKLLRVLERGEFLPVGATEVHRVDTRVISATNKDLLGEVRAGRFREDLYYRLSAFPIRVPPLRERREDIALLAAHFLKQLAQKWGRREVAVAPDAMECLVRYPWPGNVRELEHELERALTLAGDAPTLCPVHFSDRVLAAATGAGRVRLAGSLKQARDRFERDYIAHVLRIESGNVSHAARTLGISRVMLQRKMKDFGLRSAVPN
ncbi:MAG TPA: sigma 54-interacting transcriptional regulator [Candidatus Margulisiibacteriota bacterium]|nr:sigma 54-interacting transcriptional regulator [Candidatus Margulisiibacteriota bacterium]